MKRTKLSSNWIHLPLWHRRSKG